MQWKEIESSILTEYPELITDAIQVGTASLRYFYLPLGFKDIGSAICFGYLCCGSAEEFHQLIKQLSVVAKSLGAKKLVGPINFSTFFDYRLKMNNFNHLCFLGEPRNGKKELDFFKQEGFECLQKYLSHEFFASLNWKMYGSVVLAGWWAIIKTWGQYQTLNLDKNNYQRHLQEIYDITISTFADNFLFQKIPFDLFKIHFESHLLPNIDFDTSLIIFNKTGKIVAYSLCLVDLLNSKRLLFKTIGVVKGERKGGLIALRILRQVYLNARKNYTMALACLMIEGNKIDRIIKGISVDTTEYGLFQKTLPDA